jgi:uncharacterized protein (DUF58 family)
VVTAVEVFVVVELRAVIPDAGGAGGLTVIVAVAEVEPALLVAVSLAVYVPAALYVCDGFRVVDVPPSPNSQAHDVGAPVEVSVKLTGSGAVPVVGDAVKEATGAGVAAGSTVMVAVAEVEPPLFVAVSFAVYVPAAVYVWEGFCAVEVPPSPKSQAHDVGAPVEVSVKLTGNGAVPVTGEAAKDATGAGVPGS